MPEVATLHSDLRDATVLARAELRAMGRRLLGDRRQLVGAAVGVLNFAVLIPMFALGPAMAFGDRLASGGPPLGVLGALVTWALVGGGFLGAMSAINQNRIGSVGPLVRSSIPPRAVAAGRFGSELVQTAVMFGPPLAVVLLLVAAGVGGPVAPLLLGVALALPLFAALFVGRLVGATARYAGLLARLSTWTKVGALVVGTGGLFVAYQVAVRRFVDEGGSMTTTTSVPTLLPGTPMQAFAGVVLAPAGGPVRPLGVAVLAVVTVAVPLGLLAAVRAEATMLVTDVDDGTDGVARSRSIPAGFDRWPATRVGWRHLLRAVRDPRSLAHLFPLLFGIFAMFSGVVTSPGMLFALGGPAAVVFGAVVAGAAFCLNPMGDDRDQLPLLLTSVDSTDVLLRGRAVAGAVPGLLLGVAVGTPLALVGHPLAYALGQTLLAPVLIGISATVALGLGALVPKFERREYVNVERAHPSQWALMGFLFGWMLLAAIGLGLTWATATGRLGVAVGGGGLLVYVLVLAGGGFLGYRYAVRTFDALRMDDV